CDGKHAAVVIVRNVVARRGPNPYAASSLWVGSNTPSPEDMAQVGAQGKNYRWPMWRPEGDAVYIVSDADGAENLWLIDLASGKERRVTSFRDGRLLWPSISADGRTIVFERDFGIWRFDTRSHRVRAVPIHTQPDTKVPAARFQTFSRDISELALSPDAKKVAFVVHGEVFADFADKDTDKELRQGPAFRVTNTSARESYLAWAPDSRRVVYVSDRHGEPEVYLYDFVARSETRLTRIDGDKRFPQFSPDGAWIAYMCGDRALRLIDMATQTDRPFISADLPVYSSFAWAPDSKWIVFAAQDDHHFENLYVQRLDDNTAHQISFLSNLRTFNPLWAPNRDFIVFTTGQYRSEMQIARVDLRQPMPLFREREFERLFESTPADERGAGADPRRLVPPERIRDEASQIISEPPVVVPDRGLESAPPVVAPDTPAVPAPPSTPPIDIQFSGIERRLRLLTPVQLDATALCISPDSRDLVFRGGIAGKTGLWMQALDEPRAETAPRQLTAHGGAKWDAQFTPDGKSIYFVDGGQITIRKVQNGDQALLPTSAEVLINFGDEKHQVFEECWRLLRDRFYDESFGGHDWRVLHDLYQPLVEGAQTPSDLLTLLNLMIGELGVSHTGINWSYSTPGNQGYTGLVFDARE
ncbi:MAG TPA: peptidase S41, partial [Roseiflexaceae bacterium]|nr:peptidase S41 [Roseiflexaceae bacterium]